MNNEQIELIRKIVREEVSRSLESDRVIFKRNLQLLDGRSIQVGKTTGTQFGTESTQKLAFYGETPVDQPAAVSDPVISSVSGSGADPAINSNFSQLELAVEAIIDRLQETGLIA